MLGVQLGAGQDGAVWLTPRNTVVKAFEREAAYWREVRAYQRLAEHSMVRIRGFAIPAFKGCNDALLVIEIGLVVRPFLIDFGKSYVDEEPPYLDDPIRMDQWRQEGRERFGSRWPTVLRLVSALRSIGIYYFDTSPGNIAFGEDFDDDAACESSNDDLDELT